MIVREKSKQPNSKKTMVYGRGFVDTLKGIGSYVAQNKDLIARPMLGAVGDIGAFALAEGGKALIRKIASKKQLDPEAEQILERLKAGSGIKKF